ncbi:hypothetical protein LXL04_013580 [Taraxacum kok-saghyz]
MASIGAQDERGRETEDTAEGYDSQPFCMHRAFNCLQMASIGAQDERGRETEDTAEGYDSQPFCMFFLNVWEGFDSQPFVRGFSTRQTPQFPGAPLIILFFWSN